MTQEQMEAIEKRRAQFLSWEAFCAEGYQLLREDVPALLTALQEAQESLALSRCRTVEESNLRKQAQEDTARLDFILKHNPTLGWTRELIDAERTKRKA